jgi:hypothetical protein
MESTGRRPQDTIGYCVYCNKLVRRTDKAECPEGHPAEMVSGLIDSPRSEEVPTLPKFNWAAFFMPPIWGASHGAIIAGLIVIPLWLFMDSNIQSAVWRVGAATPIWTRVGVYVLTTFVVLASLALMGWFGKTGWGIAWRREYEDGTSTKSMETFIKRERIWYWICIPLFLALLGLAIYYWIAFLPTTIHANG